jgi:Outer membrane lipoprotein
MKTSSLTIAATLVLSLGLAGCVSGLQGSTYSRAEARQVQDVAFGTVIGTNPPLFLGQPVWGGGRYISASSGVHHRGVLSRQSARQRHHISHFGAVCARASSHMVEKQATRAQGLELTVRLDSGRTLSMCRVDSVDAFS